MEMEGRGEGEIVHIADIKVWNVIERRISAPIARWRSVTYTEVEVGKR